MIIWNDGDLPMPGQRQGLKRVSSSGVGLESGSKNNLMMRKGGMGGRFRLVKLCWFCPSLYFTGSRDSSPIGDYGEGGEAGVKQPCKLLHHLTASKSMS